MTYYISENGNESGYHGNPQSTRFPGSVRLPKELLEEYLAAKGFVTLEVVNDLVTAVAVDYEALDKYNEEHPDVPDVPEPTAEEDLLSMAVDHEYRITLLELGIGGEF